MQSGMIKLNFTVARALALGAALLIGASAAGAAGPKELLKPKQVKELVAKAKTADDHMKLARHYTAMAEKHEAEAKEHEALAAEYRRSPRPSEVKRPMAPDTAAHCEYYAEHCRKAAKEMRALAATHEYMAKEASR